MGETQLKRAIGLPGLVFYGVGTMVGGGFYALLGRIADEASMHAPLAFLTAGVLAMLSALSYCELSARFPVSAGEARYVGEGFRSPGLAALTGWLVVLTGVVSAAALSVATIGFLQEFLAIPDAAGILALVSLMAGVAAWGIGQSVGVVAAITIVEVGALVAAVALSPEAVTSLPERWPELATVDLSTETAGIFAGGFLAFYAFVGFEDMVNIAEEVKAVRWALPVSILLSLAITTLLYVLVSAVALIKVGPETLATSQVPVVELVREHGWVSTTGVGMVSILTGLNGALVQVVMASRVLYGLGQQGGASRWLSQVHPRTQTPVVATVAIAGVILVLALLFPLATLARWTSAIILVIFSLVNLALWRLKGRKDWQPMAPWSTPRWLAMAGCLACVAVLTAQLWQTLST